MKKHVVRGFAVLSAVLFLSISVLELNAHARAGGSRSSGSRGSRSYSSPAGSTYQSQPRQQAPQAATPFQQPQQFGGGGFMRSMAGGLVGGMLGGMLFRSLGFAGPGGMGGGMGGGIGLFEIILLAGIGYLIYRYVKKRRTETLATVGGGYQGGTVTQISDYQYAGTAPVQVDAGLDHIRRMDPSFDENRFNDAVMDTFFKIQGGWMNRDLSPVAGLLTDEMKQTFQGDLDRLLRDRQVNRLENIAVRKVEIVEAWQESGQDYVTASIYANLLDYTTDDATGAVVSGSKTDPVKFEECWTFTRPVGNNPWRLTAIDQR